MGNRLRLTGFSLLHLLLLVTTSELAFNRLASRELLPAGIEGVSWWYLALDHLGLFLHYFASALAFGMLARQLWRLYRDRQLYFGAARWALIAVGGAFLALAALNIVRSPGEAGSFGFELSFVAVVMTLVIAQVTRGGDLATKIGLALLAIPLTLPVLTPLTMHLLGDSELLWGDVPERVRQFGQWTMVAAAMLSPYCFAPRPFAASVTRLGPLVIAAFVGVVGVIILRQNYEIGMRLAHHGLGIDIGPGAPEQYLTMYLVALATITWTLSSCLTAEAEPRRDIGVGLALIVLGGYGFAWPLQYLVSTVGLMTIGEAASRVRDEERALARQPGFHAPPIAAAVWSQYVEALADALREAADQKVSVVTVSGQRPAGSTDHGHDGETTTTCLTTRRRDIGVYVTIERQRGAITVMDIMCGKPPAQGSEPQWTLYALPEKLLGIGAHPEPPETSAPVAHVDDRPFTQRFRLRDAGGFTERLLDDGLRARVTALIDGWLAFWDGHGLGYRVQPGQGAPLDHPIPITELAFRGEAAVSSSTERVVTLIDLLVDIARRGGAPHAEQPDPRSDDDPEASPEPDAPLSVN
ncbi:MAG TPA: hypothetical protein VNM90_22560 [Haliangium sp.]|nr:hypothetical protein [Haliangium sp.]